jgi:hypothetical protein
MSTHTYVIIGREVGEQGNYLHPNGTINAHNGPHAVPLNVEFIGKLMVELSERGPQGVTMAQRRDYERQIQAALTVRDFSADLGQTALSATEIADILASTRVVVEFESRTTPAEAPDVNLRFLVVPADHTLKITNDQLSGQAPVGFVPPLSYALDHHLMLANLKTDILGFVASFAQNPPAGWTQALQDALTAHVTAEIDKAVAFPGGAGNVNNQILESPLRAFHRSTGIYATNMCR